ncbi:MAG: NAD(P)H-hydrate dehydratase [Alphaproteobacteria bacterium]|nr:NAD(P)H-hydrate dehydratase [Alphaproteobacteria bacterium]
MYRADGAAMAGGISGESLMEAAGAAVVGEIRRRFEPCATVVLCGPGNNGGDGFVVARLLAEAGWPVRVALHGSIDLVKGDAALNLQRWPGPILALEPAVLDGMRLAVDAIFGAGLARPVDGQARAVVEALIARDIPVVAVDVPSGVKGDTGGVLGIAPRARLTVTFFRPKPGHLLLPGRALCGELAVADIGIPEAVLTGIDPSTFRSQPSLWLDMLPIPSLADHKYDRGHALVVAGMPMTGAGILAAQAARRAGVGMLTVACPSDVTPLFQVTMPGALVAPLAQKAEFAELLRTKRRSAVLIGPGAGVSVATGERVLAALESQIACVLDADALTLFAPDPQVLFRAIRRGGPTVLTPHDGEFARLFPADGDKLERARHAARASGAVVLLKGADTVVAHPDGRAAINANAPPDLATAGSGDVLAGIVVGLLAQGMPPFEAAAAAAWIHGAAGHAVGAGLIAEDLPDAIMGVLRRLRTEAGET